MEPPPGGPLSAPAQALLARLAAAHGVADGAAVSAAARVLVARMAAAPSLADEETLVKQVIGKLFLDGRNAEASRYARLAAALMADPALRKGGGDSWSVNYLLAALKDQAAEGAGGGAGGSAVFGEAPRAFEPPAAALPAPRAVAKRDDEAEEVRDVGGASERYNDAGDLGDNGTDGSDGSDGSDSSDGSDGDDADYYDADGNPTVAARRAAGRGGGGVGYAPASFAVPEPVRRPAEARRYSVEAERTPAVTPRAAEVLLVRDVMLVVQGEDGRFVRFSDGGGDSGGEEDGEERGGSGGVDAVVEILPLPSAGGKPLPVAASTVHVVRYIAELGFLFKVIYRRVRAVDDNPGLVSTNFCAAVEREMEAYYRSLATFNTGVDTADDRLPSLRTVYVWAEAEKPRLRWLARLCEETQNLVGGQTLAHLRSYHKSYVAADIHGMLSRIIARTAAPLDLMLIRWVTEGVLVDPHGEFYIMESPTVAAAAAKAAAAVAASGVASIDAPERFDRMLAGGPNAASSASHRIWWGLFVVRRDMIPGVQSRAVVENTLIAGKSIAFLRRCCGDALWVDQVHAPALSQYLAEQSSAAPGIGDVSGRGFAMGSGLLDQDPRLAGTDHVAELVARAVRSASIRLKTLFFEKFDLGHHFAAIKNYLLLSQGDFTQALMDSLAPLLDGDGRILRNNITGLLDAALRGSSSFDPATDGDIAERLDVQILAQSGDECVGWDVFSLTYRVEDAPLNTVFSTKVMDAYLEIFRFLWRLKRMDYVLGNAFMELRELDAAWRRRRKLRIAEGYVEDAEEEVETEAEETVATVLNRAHFLRMKMGHVLQNVQYYCTFEVLEGNWKVLSDEMGRAEDINSLIEAHSRYLGAIKDRTLRSKRSHVVARALDAVLNTILSFRATQRALCRWGARLPRNARVAGDSSNSGAVEMDEVLRLSAQLHIVDGAFDRAVEQFLYELAGHARTVGSSMFLVFRLDYNGFFAGRALAARNEKGVGDGVPEDEEGEEVDVSGSFGDSTDGVASGSGEGGGEEVGGDKPGATIAVDSGSVTAYPGNVLDPAATTPVATG